MLSGWVITPKSVKRLGWDSERYVATPSEHGRDLAIHWIMFYLLKAGK